MRALLTISMAITWLAATTAAAQPGESCCACLPSPGAQASGPLSRPALFCGLVTSEPEQIAFAGRCYDADGGTLCVAETAMAAQQDHLNCPALLAEEGIICPSAKAVPAAGQPLLLGLALLLAGAGAWAARRTLRR